MKPAWFLGVLGVVALFIMGIAWPLAAGATYHLDHPPPSGYSAAQEWELAKEIASQLNFFVGLIMPLIILCHCAIGSAICNALREKARRPRARIA